MRAWYSEKYGLQNVQSHPESPQEVPEDTGAQSETSRKHLRSQEREPCLAVGEGELHSKSRECGQALHRLSHNGGCAFSGSLEDAARGNLPPGEANTRAGIAGKMTERYPHDEIRKMDEGGWYWILKVIIQEYAPKVGAMGIAVYNFLASMADRNQSCFPSQQYIADRLGYSRPTVNKALKRLQDHGLIRKETRSRYHCVYRLLQVRCKAGETQVSTAGNSDVAQGDTNNTMLTRNNNNTLVCVSQKKPNTELRPQTREELLASDIAQVLGSHDRIDLYRSFARRYPEPFLREILSQVKQTPDGQIKKSRAALFAYLVKQNDHGTA